MPEFVVRCLGCGKTTSNPKAKNWQEHQLCYKCAREAFPLEYVGEPHHGTGGSRMNQETRCASLIVS